MLSVKENTTLVGISELRTKMDEVLKTLKTSKVIVEKRHRPIAVLLPLRRYEEIEEILDLIEDKALGYLAREREGKGKQVGYLSLDKAEKKVELK